MYEYMEHKSMTVMMIMMMMMMMLMYSTQLSGVFYALLWVHLVVSSNVFQRLQRLGVILRQRPLLPWLSLPVRHLPVYHPRRRHRPRPLAGEALHVVPDLHPRRGVSVPLPRSPVPSWKRGGGQLQLMVWTKNLSLNLHLVHPLSKMLHHTPTLFLSLARKLLCFFPNHVNSFQTWMYEVETILSLIVSAFRFVEFSCHCTVYTTPCLVVLEHLYSPRMVAEIKEGKIQTANEQTVMWPNYLN